MSRNLFPALFAIGVGIFTGYYTFNPTFAQLQYEKEQARKPSPPSDPSVSNRGTDFPASATVEQNGKPLP